MQPIFYSCTGCCRILTRRERVFWDDPQAPFGPEWVCPDCHSLVILRAKPAVISLAVVLSLLFGIGVGYLLN